MFKQIAHVCLNVRDLEASFDFYENTLKLKKTFVFEKNGKVAGAYFEVGAGCYVEMFQKDFDGVTNTGITHFCLETDDIDDVVAWFDARNVEHTDKKLGSDQSWQIWVTDPDGNRIEVHEYTESSSQHTGRTALITW